MSSDSREIEFYPDICKKIRKHVIDTLQDDSVIAFSMNRTLPEMIREIETELGLKTDFENDYIPRLQLDIVFGIKGNDGKIKLCLVEVKKGKTLNLMNYSQLVGYMQVAKKIPTGLLWLVTHIRSPNPISNDFNEIISMQKLSASWEMCCNSSSKKFPFDTGICAYVVVNGIDWVPLDGCGGISNWAALIDNMIAS